jgi:hypothetical protein
VDDPQLSPGDRAKRLREIAKGYQQTQVEYYATKLAADLLYEQGKMALVADQSKAREYLDEALVQYKSLTSKGDVPVEIARQAALSVGIVEETKDALENARKAYKAVADSHPNTHAARVANAALERLKSSSAQQFYVRLAEYKSAGRSVDDSGIPSLPPPLFGNDSDFVPPPPPPSVLTEPGATKTAEPPAGDEKSEPVEGAAGDSSKDAEKASKSVDEQPPKTAEEDKEQSDPKDCYQSERKDSKDGQENEPPGLSDQDRR